LRCDGFFLVAIFFNEDTERRHKIKAANMEKVGIERREREREREREVYFLTNME